VRLGLVQEDVELQALLDSLQSQVMAVIQTLKRRSR
jgi:hypothetical protein